MELLPAVRLTFLLCLLPSSVICHDDEDKLCDCCPWKLVLSNDCLFGNVTPSFEEMTLTLSLHHASRHDESIMNVVMAAAWNGIGYTNESINAECRGSFHMNSTLQKRQQIPAWSLNYKATTLSAKTRKRWNPFAKQVRNHNQGVPVNFMDEFLALYEKDIFSKFERHDECGKITEDQERRCLHHVISPLEVDEQIYWRFQNNNLTKEVRVLMNPVS